MESQKKSFFPTLNACHPDCLRALKNGENMQKFADDWVKDESKFQERHEWNLQNLLKTGQDWKRRHPNDDGLTIEKAIMLNLNKF